MEDKDFKFKFSVPMPTNTDSVLKLLNINKRIEKSSITSLYFALPRNCIDNTGFEQLRTVYEKETRFKDFAELISLVKTSGFDFIYLLNSPKAFLIESSYFGIQLDKLDNLINNLRNLGCNKYRVCNPQLIGYLQNNYPDIEIYSSTSLEYQNIQTYSNFLNMYGSVKEVVPAVDLNKNFKFLKNFKKKFPNIKLELMVNEGCLYSCPLRYTHNLSMPYAIKDFSNGNPAYTFKYFPEICNRYAEQNLEINLCNHNIIYPWEIEEYGKLGINNFKLVGRNIGISERNKYADFYLIYLSGIDDYKNIENIPVNAFNFFLMSMNIDYTVKQIRKYLPDIEYFKKHGHLCSSECGVECNYCYECAEKIKNFKNYS